MNAHTAAKLIARLFMIGALAASYSHIVALFNDWGLHGWEAYAAPLFVDGFAVLGLIGRGAQFSEATRRTGFRLQVAATLISLIANILAGTSFGGQVFGALVVIGYVVAEWYCDQLRPTADDAAAKRSASAKQAAVTRAANRKAGTGTRKPAAAKTTVKGRTVRKRPQLVAA